MAHNDMYNTKKPRITVLSPAEFFFLGGGGTTGGCDRNGGYKGQTSMDILLVATKNKRVKSKSSPK